MAPFTCNKYYMRNKKSSGKLSWTNNETKHFIISWKQIIHLPVIIKFKRKSIWPPRRENNRITCETKMHIEHQVRHKQSFLVVQDWLTNSFTAINCSSVKRHCHPWEPKTIRKVLKNKKIKKIVSHSLLISIEIVKA